MAIIRIKHSDFESKYKVPEQSDTLNAEEWAADDANRVNDPGWNERYEYEAQLICSIIDEKTPAILELGSGPGVLCEKIQAILNKQGKQECKYDLIDKFHAKEAFEKAKRKGRFFVKDLSSGFDVTGLLSNYTLIIANDFLEHVFNPSMIVQEVRKLLNNDGKFFVSVPNWRMGHQFVYRGLWDYDNFLYFMIIHGFEAIDVYSSPLQTPDYPRLSSEDSMPEELRRSWNWYFVFAKK